jgi:hypothetical protein
MTPEQIMKNCQVRFCGQTVLMREEYKLALVRGGDLRMISSVRARKLRQKHERVWWDKDLLSWVRGPVTKKIY